MRLQLLGELDIATVSHLDQVLRAAAKRATVVILDLRRLDFIDGCGAKWLLSADRQVRAAGGRLVILRGPAEIDWLLARIGVVRALPLVDQPLHDIGGPCVIVQLTRWILRENRSSGSPAALACHEVGQGPSTISPL